MRGRPGPKERGLGVALLILVAMVTLAFGLTTGVFGRGVSHSGVVRAIKSALGISDRPLFTVDRSKQAPPLSHEMRVFLAMLPKSVETLDLADDSAGAPEVLALDASPDESLQAGLVEAARDFGVARLWRANYATPAKGGLGVHVLDAGEPETAFGMWRSLRPADARPMSIGRGGWQCEANGDHRIAFWAGRYYTEIAAGASVESGEAARLVEGLARALVARQIVWGGPFWADSVLPAEGRIADSLRFVKRNPLGLRLEVDCWLADYDGSMTLGAMKLPADRREAVFAAVRELIGAGPAVPSESADHATEPDPQPQAPGQVAEATASDGGDEAVYEQSESGSDDEVEPRVPARGSDGESVAGSAGSIEGLPAGAIGGTVGGKALVACPAGEYVFLAQGPDAAALVAAAGPLVVKWSAAPAAVAAAGPEPSAAPAATGRPRFVDLGDPELLAPTSIERYTDNLYEKIDGREPQFRQFGFIELRVGTYQHIPKQALYDAYVFDMGEPVNAMGIYMTEKSGSARSAAVGRDGYVSGANVYFWKGNYYVYILGPADAGEDGAKVAERVAHAIADTIADAREPFWAERLLPADDRVPDSLSYRASSGLGFDFLRRMFVASYNTGGKTYQMYILRNDSAAAAKALFGQFAEATAKYDKVVSRSELPDGEMLVSESLGVYGAAFYKGIYFGGVAECDDRALAEKRAAMMRESLPEK